MILYRSAIFNIDNPLLAVIWTAEMCISSGYDARGKFNIKQLQYSRVIPFIYFPMHSSVIFSNITNFVFQISWANVTSEFCHKLPFSMLNELFSEMKSAIFINLKYLALR